MVNKKQQILLLIMTKYGKNESAQAGIAYTLVHRGTVLHAKKKAYRPV